MKKYRLLKDLPTFKAGEIFKLNGGNLYYYPAENGTRDAHWSDKIMAYNHKTLEKFPNILDEWFEEVEEPKEHWMIDVFGDVDIVSSIYTDDMIDELREICNYFSSKEEAKLAVERLKAWKRLKDKGADFVFIKSQGIYGNVCRYRIELCTDTSTLTDEDARADLDLLFSRGEE